MNTKINITSILNNATNLTDIYKFYRDNYPSKEFLFTKFKEKWTGQSFEQTDLIINRLVSFFLSIGLEKEKEFFYYPRIEKSGLNSILL